MSNEKYFISEFKDGTITVKEQITKDEVERLTTITDNLKYFSMAKNYMEIAIENGLELNKYYNRISKLNTINEINREKSNNIGTTTDNLELKSTGWLLGKLSQKGIEQSIIFKGQVDINQFDVVFCSDLQRAIDSAKYTFEGVKEIIQDERLRECNYGEYNGQDSSLVKYEEHITEKFPNGECILDVEKRIKDFCDYLLENYNGKHIAIVAHKAPL